MCEPGHEEGQEAGTGYLQGTSHMQPVRASSGLKKQHLCSNPGFVILIQTHISAADPLGNVISSLLLRVLWLKVRLELSVLFEVAASCDTRCCITADRMSACGSFHVFGCMHVINLMNQKLDFWFTFAFIFHGVYSCFVLIQGPVAAGQHVGGPVLLLINVTVWW